MKVNDLLKKSCRIVKSALFFRLPKIPSAVCAGLIPPLTYYLCELYYHNPFETPLSLQIIGWLPYYLTAALIFGCCGRASIALAVSTSLHTVIALINSYVIIFRGSPILPWDILSVRTAVSVADGFDFTPDARTLICSVLLLVLIFISAHTELRIRGAKLRVPTALMSAALFCGFALSMQSDKIGDAIGLYEMPFTQKYTYRQNGFWPSFFMNAKYLVVDVPEGYSEDEVRSIEAKLPEAEQTSGGTPNIVVVVDEAFSDLSVLGHFETNIEVMPFYKSLVGSENTVTGVSYTSILGGNTANTEFEFLTGDTMAFLPSGSIPYQQYINEATSALPRAMTAYGYASTFIHPYGAAGWNRNIVCPYLGFQTCLFDTDLKYGRYIRNRISDKSVCDYIFDAYENKEDGTPTFIYALTMQNHSGYSTKYANFSPYVHVLGFENDQIYSAETYLTLIRETDNALRKLINYFSTVDEDTVVIFFGDHQPSSIESAFTDYVLGANTWSISGEELAKRYQVPFLIWANYDIEEKTDVRTSMNYLALELMDAAGLPYTDYQRYLSVLRENAPIVTANFFYDENGVYHDISDMDSDNFSDVFYPYRILQYRHIFGGDVLSDGFFTPPADEGDQNENS